MSVVMLTGVAVQPVAGNANMSQHIDLSVLFTAAILRTSVSFSSTATYHKHTCNHQSNDRLVCCYLNELLMNYIHFRSLLLSATIKV